MPGRVDDLDTNGHDAGRKHFQPVGRAARHINCDTSMMRPETKGPRSLMRTITDRPAEPSYLTRTRVPSGSEQCAAVNSPVGPGTPRKRGRAPRLRWPKQKLLRAQPARRREALVSHGQIVIPRYYHPLSNLDGTWQKGAPDRKGIWPWTPGAAQRDGAIRTRSYGTSLPDAAQLAPLGPEPRMLVGVPVLSRANRAMNMRRRARPRVPKAPHAPMGVSQT